MSTSAESPDDILNAPSDDHSIWSRTNVVEALPGVLTPLTWSFWEAMELAGRRVYRDIGALGRGEVRVPERPEDRWVSIFSGRAAARLDFVCAMADRMPGTSGAALAEQLFSSELPEEWASRSARRYYPRVLARLPVAFLKAPGGARRQRVVIDPWWRQELERAATLSLDEARRGLLTARERFGEVLYWQVLNLALRIQAVFEIMRRATGDRGSTLWGGQGSHEETQMVRDLWECSRDGLSLEEFLDRHGFHGPREGELSGPAWREEPSAVVQLIDAYRALPDEADPQLLEARLAAERKAEEAALLATLPVPKRLLVHSVLRLAATSLPLRAVGKMAFLQTIDVGRVMARRIGTCLVEQGLLDRSDDIFFLTLTEIDRREWNDARELVAERRLRNRQYETVDLPLCWQGRPTPVPANTALDAQTGTETDVLHGVGASPGVVEGRVRVVLDPTTAEIEPGEILVAHTTDPSWASIMYLSPALIMDIGGMLSHAAVVARELGIPCVTALKVATRVLRTGDVCRVDGTNGVVQIRR